MKSSQKKYHLLLPMALKNIDTITLSLSKNFKEATPQSHKKISMDGWNMEEKLSYNL